MRLANSSLTTPGGIGFGHRLDRDGSAVGPRLAKRFARAILELGGNNAAIVAPTADLDLTLRGVAFAAMEHPASAARRYAACSCMNACTTPSCRV